MALVFPLPRHSFFTGTVMWSEDHRIAVVSNETIYICVSYILQYYVIY